MQTIFPVGHRSHFGSRYHIWLMRLAGLLFLWFKVGLLTYFVFAVKFGSRALDASTPRRVYAARASVDCRGRDSHLRTSKHDRIQLSGAVFSDSRQRY